MKLGYGGTKTEMQRLVKDAAKLDKSIDANSLSYGNIVKAIHAVQKNLGIYGTTQKEAEHTVTGSLNSMKSAWGNLLAAIGSGENLEQCFSNMEKTLETFLGNIMPVIERALEGFGNVIDKVVPKFAAKFPKIAKELIPPLIKGAISIAQGLIKALPSIIKTVADTIVDIFGDKISVIGKVVNFFKANSSKIVNAIKSILSTAVEFGQKLMTVLAPVLSFIGNLAVDVFVWIGDNISWLLPLVTALVGAFMAYKLVMGAVNVITGIVTAGQTIMATVCGTASAAAATGTTAVGTAASISTPQILGFAAAILALGLAIFLICAGFALLIQSAIALATAGWGAIAVFVGLIVVIALLTIGLAILAPVLTAGAIGFIAFGAAVLMVGAGFALLGLGAMLAATALSIIAGTLLIITQYGLMGAVSIMALGAGLVIFAVGAGLAGLAALVLAAGLLPLVAELVLLSVSAVLFAGAMAIIALSMLLITTMITTFVNALAILPLLFIMLVPQILMFAASMIPLVATMLAVIAPFTLFTALVAVLAAAFLILFVSATGLLLVLTAMSGVVLLLNMQFMLMMMLFSIMAVSIQMFVLALMPLPIIFMTLIPFVLAFTLAITPLTLLFVALGVSSLIFATSMVVVSAALMVIVAMVTILNVGLTMLSMLFIMNNMFAMLLSISLMMLSVAILMLSTTIMMFTGILTMLSMILVMITPSILLFTACLLPLSGVMLMLVPTTLLFTVTMAALMAIFAILSPLAMMFTLSMMLLNPICQSLSKTVPIFAEALLPLPKAMAKLIIPSALLVAALLPLSAEFAILSASAVILLVSFTGLVVTSAMLVALFRMMVVALMMLIQAFVIIGVIGTKLISLLLPMASALTKTIVPLMIVSACYSKFAKSLIVAVLAMAIINGAFSRMAQLIMGAIALLSVLLIILSSVGNQFTEIAKTPIIFSDALNEMASKSGVALMLFVGILTVALTTSKLLVYKIATDITKFIDKCISNIVDKISQLPIKMGEGIKDGGKSLSNALVSIWKDAVKASVSPVNKVIEAANWILKEFGSDKRVTSWTPYAKGTNGHKGGNALVNDGRGAELVQMPNGNSFIPQGRNIFIPNAPKGMKVLSAEQTAQLMGRKSPTFRYANGNIDIWSFIDNAKGVGSAIEKSISCGNAKGLGLHIGKGMVSTLTGQMSAWFEKLVKEMGVVNYDASKGVTQWRALVIRALKMTGQYSAANVIRTLYQMQTESGGNPKAINLWDSNAKKGTPSKGLMQVIDPTFRAYAKAGFNKNIYDPLSNILASIRYAVSRYGSLARAYQGHGYANGGIATKPSIFGEDGAEMAIPLSSNKRKRGISLWKQTGSILGVGMSSYTPENSEVSYSNTRSTEYNTYSPQFNFTISGTGDERALTRKIKRCAKEAFDEMLDTMASKSPQVQEV